MSQKYCFYHSSDLDGHCSGEIIRRFFDVPDHNMIGINYGESFPWDKIRHGDEVYMVDFCLQPFSDMLRLNDMCHLVWIDHHETAIQAWADEGSPIIPGNRRVGEAGCELSFAYAKRYSKTLIDLKMPMPLFVHLLGRYDVWDHKHPMTMPVQYGLRMEPTKPGDPIWGRLFEDGLRASTPVGEIPRGSWLYRIHQHGQTALHYQHQQDEMYASAYAFDTTLLLPEPVRGRETYKAIAVNKLMGNSHLFNSVYDPARHDLMIAFGYNPRGRNWMVSLYSDQDGVHVGEIAKVLGGGGHAGAAGFQNHFGQDWPFVMDRDG